jgi:non-ribosomal peptide synthetase component F
VTTIPQYAGQRRQKLRDCVVVILRLCLREDATSTYRSVEARDMLMRAVTAAGKTPVALPPTLAGLVDLRAKAPGDAVVFADERADYPQFAEATIEMARRLHGAGVRKGDRVGLLMNASLDAFALQVGAMRLGAIPVPINARFKALELHYVIRHSGMRILVAEPIYGHAGPGIRRGRGGRRRRDRRCGTGPGGR